MMLLSVFQADCCNPQTERTASVAGRGGGLFCGKLGPQRTYSHLIGLESSVLLKLSLLLGVTHVGTCFNRLSSSLQADELPACGWPGSVEPGPPPQTCFQAGSVTET